MHQSLSANHPLIRSATIADAPAISACVGAAYAHYIPRMGKRPGPMFDDYAQIIKGHTVYVIDCEPDLNIAELGGLKMAAVLVLMENVLVPKVLADKDGAGNERGLLLDNIAVHPNAQGRGYGRLLATLAERVAQERGYNAIHLYTHELMTENIQLYKRWGYTETERRTEKGFQRIYMQKPLC